MVDAFSYSIVTKLEKGLFIIRLFPFDSFLCMKPITEFVENFSQRRHSLPSQLGQQLELPPPRGPQ